MEHNEVMQLRDPSHGERFKWFAISHFSISIIGVLGVFLSILFEGAMIAVLFVWEVVLLALYVFAGAWIARKLIWSRPRNMRDGIRTFLSPTLVAWIWGGVFLVMLCSARIRLLMGDAGDIITIVIMHSLLFLAFPSSCGFVMLTLFVGGVDANFAAEWPLFFVYMLVVGAVPPGLFLLGSVLGVRKTSGEEQTE